MLAETTGVRLLADCISTARSLAAVERARKAGVKVACSVASYSLFFNELDVGDYLTYCKVQPPFRGEADRMALIDGLKRGVIDAVVSAHDPQPTEDKRLPIADAAYGAVGLETLLPALLSIAAARGNPAGRRAEARDQRPGRPARPAAGPAGQGRARRPRPVRSRRALGVRPGRPVLTLQELALRRPQARRQGLAHLGERRDRVRARLRTSHDRSGLDLVRRCGRVRLSARLDPVRAGASPRWPGSATSAPSAPAISARPTCCGPDARISPLATLLLDAGKAGLAFWLCVWGVSAYAAQHRRHLLSRLDHHGGPDRRRVRLRRPLLSRSG